MRIGTPNLTVLPGHEVFAQTESGMACWAGTGPANATCRECASWCRSSSFKRGKDGELLPRQCQKFTRMMSAHGAAISHDNAACRYFTRSKRAPKIIKRK